MQLLVSVRSAEEAEAALAGGADIIDCKEPSRGSIGAVDSKTLAGILGHVPARWPLSIALGDVMSAAETGRMISSLSLPGRVAPTYLKLGFAQVSTSVQIEDALRSAVAAATTHKSRPKIIAVAYADAESLGSASCPEILDAAARAGCAGVLLDTQVKNGRNLFHWVSVERLIRWVGVARREGLLVALAGGLNLSDVPAAAELSPDVIGVRGAACDGGRMGTVRAAKVAELQSTISGFGLFSSFKKPTLRARSRKA
jgi:uncharacterized protein (UPF0264 family)